MKHRAYYFIISISRKNFIDGWEREGAAISIYRNGELVVDLQGGYADASSLRPWTSDTRTVVFSATKVRSSFLIYQYNKCIFDMISDKIELLCRQSVHYV